MAYIAKQRSSRERGFMTVMFLLLLGLFLTFTVFALDLGNLYLWKLRLEKAARAGAQAGIGHRGLTGWTATSNNQSGLTNAVRSAVEDNFRAYSPLLPQTVSSNFDALQDTVTVEASFNVPTFLYGRLRNIFAFGFNAGKSTPPLSITTTQSAQLNPATVVLIVDISGSMNCPANANANCACRNTGTCNAAASKLERLKTASQRFVEFFNPNRDRIAAISFNISARQFFNFNQQNNQNPRSWIELTDGINALTASSNTNPCDALGTAIGALNNLAPPVPNVPLSTQPFVVLFTDGAPNAFRGEFPGNAFQDGRARTLYHYALEWVDTSPDGTTRTYRGPSPFLEVTDTDNPTIQAAIPQTFEAGPGQITPQSDDAVTVQLCGTVQPEPRFFQRTIWRNGASAAVPTAGCFNGRDGDPFPQFFIPNTNGRATVRSVPSASVQAGTDPDWPNSASPARFQKYDELPYYCAIEAADYIRTNFGGTIFTVGLGPAQMSNACPDPLQDADDHVSRKDLFLARLAFSRQIFPNMEDPKGDLLPRYKIKVAGAQTIRTLTGGNCAGHRYIGSGLTPLIGYTGSAAASTTGIPIFDNSNTFKDLRPQRPAELDPYRRRINTQGEYYATNNADEVPNIFSMIAKTILLRSAS